MSKIIRTRKPSVLPFYAMALVFLVLCAVLPVYKLWALLAALGGAFVAFGAAQKVCPPRVVEHEVPFHTGVEDVDAMLTDIQQKLAVFRADEGGDHDIVPALLILHRRASQAARARDTGLNGCASGDGGIV